MEWLKRRWLAYGLAVAAVCSVVIIWQFIEYRRARAKIHILVTGSLRACITPRSKGDYQSGGLVLLSAALHDFALAVCRKDCPLFRCGKLIIRRHGPA